MQVHASPAVRRIAREHGISLETLRGTGPDGRITKGAERCHELAHIMCPAASACIGGGITAFLRVLVHGVLYNVPLTSPAGRLCPASADESLVPAEDILAASPDVTGTQQPPAPGATPEPLRDHPAAHTQSSQGGLPRVRTAAVPPPQPASPSLGAPASGEALTCSAHYSCRSAVCQRCCCCTQHSLCPVGVQQCRWL